MNILKNNINHKCHICGKSNFRYKYSWFDYNFNIKTITYNIIKCQDCGLEQIFPIPTRDEQITFYPQNYYSKHLTERKSSMKDKLISLESIIFSIFDRKCFKLPDFCWNGVKNFLDIWCWDWKNINTMSKKWWNSFGFEIWNKNDFKNGIYYAKSIVDVKFNEIYDVIWCNHVFEHVDNPVDFLQKVNQIMKNDWRFIINLPNVEWISGYIFGKYAVERDIPRHLYWYNYKNIQKLFNDAWFNIICAHRWRQSAMATSLTWAILWKYGQDIREYYWLYILLWALFIPVEFIISLFKITNSMWFVLMKK